MTEYILCLSAFLLSIILTVTIENKLFPILKAKAKQPIYAEGPSWHLSKSGTPTMGGAAFVIAITLSLFICALVLIFHLEDRIISGISLITALLFTLGNSLIGIFDDLMKLMRKKNAGLTPMQKIILQTVLAIIFLMARRHFFGDSTRVELSFFSFDLGMIYYPMALILILGVVNCANLTDGIDGLAASVGATVGAVFLFLGQGATDIPIISSALIGGTLGFLFFNAHPAKIFMGDTGSLFIGAMTVNLAFSMKNPWTIILIGSVYVIEGISVILQVIFFKMTKKRLFKMAPLHHHLEKCGIAENRICVLAVIVTVVLSAIVPLALRI